MAIGDQVLDLAVLHEAGLFGKAPLGEGNIFALDALNPFLAMGRPAWRAVRETVQGLLADTSGKLRDDKALRARALHAQREVTLQLPVRVGNYTDFYSSYHHAHNVGTMLRGADNALMPNWKWLPVAYHGRASSIVVSGQPVRRPKGTDQTAGP